MPKPRSELFKGYTAWFSASCNPKYENMWLKAGGALDCLDVADFIVSEKAQEEDTIAIFQNAEYIKQHLTVFKPLFIEEAYVKEKIDHIQMGKYVLSLSTEESTVDHKKDKNYIETPTAEVAASCSKDCESQSPPAEPSFCDNGTCEINCDHSVKRMRMSPNTTNAVEYLQPSECEGMVQKGAETSENKAEILAPTPTKVPKNIVNCQLKDGHMETNIPGCEVHISVNELNGNINLESSEDKLESSTRNDVVKDGNVHIVDLRNLREGLSIDELHDCIPSMNGIDYVKMCEGSDDHDITNEEIICSLAFNIHELI